MTIKLFLFLSLIACDFTAEIKTLLSGYEWKLKPKSFLDRSEDTVSQLMDISQSEQVRYHIRVRAIIALSLFKEERVIQFIEKQIDNQPQAATLLRHVSSLSKLTSKDSDRFVRTAKKLIMNKDDQVRLSVAKGLKKINTRSSRSLLKVQASNESNPAIKRFIENGRIY
ncbi:MAG: hypothetical protein KC646_05825 [Candidatus Cloacimonetes bacterium]|nr:hypothetical protein [Candidatus Cloacimonadota bacterium]